MEKIIEVEVPMDVDAMAKAYAAENKIPLPEAYRRLIDAGLKALGCGGLAESQP